MRYIKDKKGCSSVYIFVKNLLKVINVYLGLLKEREQREPKKFLKCHFFSTFFYNKVSNYAVTDPHLLTYYVVNV